MKKQSTPAVVFIIAGLLAAGLVGWLIWAVGSPSSQTAGFAGNATDTSSSARSATHSSEEVTHLAESDATTTDGIALPTADESAPRPQAARPHAEDPFLPPNAVVEAPQGRTEPTVVYRPTNVMPVIGDDATDAASDPSAPGVLTDDPLADSRGPGMPATANAPESDNLSEPGAAEPQTQPVEPAEPTQPQQSEQTDPGTPPDAIPGDEPTTVPPPDLSDPADGDAVEPLTPDTLPGDDDNNTSGTTEESAPAPAPAPEPAPEPAPAPVQQQIPDSQPSGSGEFVGSMPWWQRITGRL